MKDYKNPIYATMKMARANLSRIADNIYQQGYEAGKAATPFTDTEEAENKAYNRGLNESWEMVRKIIEDVIDGGYSSDVLREIFGVSTVQTIFKLNTASKAIAKIKAYEDKQKQDDWRDIPSDEMTLEQARRAVKELRTEVLKEMRGAENDE